MMEISCRTIDVICVHILGLCLYEVLISGLSNLIFWVFVHMMIIVASVSGCRLILGNLSM